MEKVIEVKSYFGANIKNEYIVQDKNVLNFYWEMFGNIYTN